MEVLSAIGRFYLGMLAVGAVAGTVVANQLDYTREPTFAYKERTITLGRVSATVIFAGVGVILMAAAPLSVFGFKIMSTTTVGGHAKTSLFP